MAQLLARRRRRRDRHHVQAEFAFRTHGGARRGAGRKKRVSSRVAHRARPRITKDAPLHITLRLVDGIANLRTSRFFRTIHNILVKAGAELPLRIIHYSVQCTHIHLLAECPDNAACSASMRTFGIRLAKGVNTMMGREGAVIRDRYHVHVLRTPREIRHAIAYVLCNSRKHAFERGFILPERWLDPCSSARTFDAWRDERGRALRIAEHRDPAVSAPQSWLLRVAWRRHGGIAVNFIPGSPIPIH